jgi:hypothetical protein
MHPGGVDIPMIMNAAAGQFIEKCGGFGQGHQLLLPCALVKPEAVSCGVRRSRHPWW